MLALANGAVLVVAGLSQRDLLSSSEILEARAKSWRDAGALPFGRRNPGLLELPDGRVLLFGGQNPEASQPCPPAVWEPKDNRWLLPRAIPPASGLCGAGATLLSDGRVLLAGGHDRYSASTRAGIWDARADTWTETAEMPFRREGHAMVRLSNGSVAVAGGEVQTASQFVPVNVLDHNSKWRETVSVRAPFWPLPGGTLLLANGDLLLCGLSSCAQIPPKWEPNTTVINVGAWSTFAKPASEPDVVVPLADGTLLLLSGAKAPGSTGSWREGRRPKEMRDNATLTALPDGRVLLVGGYDWKSRSPHQGPHGEDTAEVLDPKTGAWSPAGRMHSPRSGHTACLLANGEVMVSGGTNSEKLEPPGHRHNFLGYHPPAIGAANLSSVEILVSEPRLANNRIAPRATIWAHRHGAERRARSRHRRHAIHLRTRLRRSALLATRGPDHARERRSLVPDQRKVDVGGANAAPARGSYGDAPSRWTGASRRGRDRVQCCVGHSRRDLDPFDRPVVVVAGALLATSRAHGDAPTRRPRPDRRGHDSRCRVEPHER